MRWRLVLEGEGIDLDNLSRWFPSGPVHVRQDEDGTHLVGGILDAEPQATDAYALGEDLLRNLNGAAKALRGSEFMSVRLSGRVLDETAPNATVVMGGPVRMVIRVVATATAEVRDSNGNLTPQPPPPGPDLYERSMSDEALRESLRWMGAPGGPNWAHLWKSFETLRRAAGGTRALADRCGVTLDEIDAFKASANDPAISGDDARHAVHDFTHPDLAMTADQGCDFVGRLIQAW